MRRNLFLIFFVFVTHITVSQTFDLSGRVINFRTKTPVEFAAVSIPESQLWGIADEKGDFSERR
ncbi:MAG: hypothetical protein LBJ72_02500 [Dysgonamonadaceae bacterium]|jgi:hypothetical protein|nr:hypothetical protein [Dysgonamonadaceae bacterium]